MDLIYTDPSRVDQGVLEAYAFDLSYGAEENDFEVMLGANEPMIEPGSVVYIEGTEYGGQVDGMKVKTDGETVTYKGRTWHGILNSKVIVPLAEAEQAGDNVTIMTENEDGVSYVGKYLIISGDANDCIRYIVKRHGLSGLFTVPEEKSWVEISKYKFHRYCKGYDGLRAMLEDAGAKLKIEWKDRSVLLCAEPISDYTEYPIDGDIASLTVEQHKNKVNHLICLGKGELEAREIIHLYVDQNGNIGDTQFYTGMDEYTDVYENTNAESSEDLRSGGVSRLKELRNNDKAEIALPETEGLSYDIGDIVGASEIRTSVNVAAAVTQKIVRINNGVVSADYKTSGGSNTITASTTAKIGTAKLGIMKLGS